MIRNAEQDQRSAHSIPGVVEMATSTELSPLIEKHGRLARIELLADAQ